MQLAGADIRLLRVFEAVARHGGFAAAQSELNIAQPTISNHITALEERLGISLCQRGRGGFSLTDKGRVVIAATEKLLHNMDNFSLEVGEIRGKMIGELRIGLVDCIATDPNNKLALATKMFNAYPNDVLLNYDQEEPLSLQDKVRDGSFHLGIGSFPNKSSSLEYIQLYEEFHSLYCSKDHPLFNIPDDEMNLEMLQEEATVSRGYWRESYRKKMGFDNSAAIVKQIEPQLILIESGQYIGFLPSHFAKKWVDEGLLRALMPKEIEYICMFDLALKKGYRKTLVIETFLKCLLAAHDVKVNETDA